MAGSGLRLTYTELDDASLRLANALRAAGLRRGEVVALLADNDPRCFEVYWAALRSGLYITAVNRHLSVAEAAYIVNDCGAAALIASGALAPLAAAVAEHAPAVRLRLAYGGETAGFGGYAAAVAAASTEPLDDLRAGTDMLYSSGTTRRPKGIRPPLPDYRVDEEGWFLPPLLGSFYGMGPGTVYLSPAPVYHSAPLRFGGAVHWHGGTVVIMETFDAEAALRAIETYRITHSQWVPTMFIRLLRLPEQTRARYDLSSHRCAVHAAAPCPPEVKRAMLDWWGPIIHEYYASTESITITFIGPDEWLARPGSVGRSALGPGPSTSSPRFPAPPPASSARASCATPTS